MAISAAEAKDYIQRISAALNGDSGDAEADLLSEISDDMLAIVREEDPNYAPAERRAETALDAMSACWERAVLALAEMPKADRAALLDRLEFYESVAKALAGDAQRATGEGS